MIELGILAYEAYRVSCDGKSIRGEDLPPWKDQAPEIREHWRAAADAVRMHLEAYRKWPTHDEESTSYCTSLPEHDPGELGCRP